MSADSAARDSARVRNKQTIDRARTLCAEALEICDALELSPQIGARLQEVISDLEEISKVPGA